MDMLRSMKIYSRVAESGSFTGGAQQLGVTTAQASRAISELEAHLRTRLLNRTTRRVAMTDAGARYLLRCQEIIERVEVAEAEAGDARALPTGHLRIHAPSAFGQHYVVPALARYLRKYPSVRVDLTLSQQSPDLLEEGYDVSLVVTTGRLPDSGMVSARLCTMPSVLCASQEYLERTGAPRTIADLRGHNCLQLRTSFFAPDKWVFEGNPSGGGMFELPPGKLRVNSVDALAVAVRESVGIAPVPLLTALPMLKSGELVRVLPGFELQTMTIYAIYASREYLDAKISTWIATLREHVEGAMVSFHDITGREDLVPAG
ncbi:LysR family transcriptional regulator [Paraburkholderia gardini]|uniref:HTH-type transcriptional regulator DmlR n=1 Tax=Paraburkholderia gardini TaxID=2823469 RepID=A0ABN7QQE9_9BURK|nr:LysR family transcriptional regulator [Paraburkholderia gardini]CAG4909578.1 HTH-type transcriptional regulator DmlR [Paraburkholderia gardini]